MFFLFFSFSFLLDNGNFPHLLFSQDCTPTSSTLILNRSFPSGIAHQRAVNSIIFPSIWPSTSLSFGRHPFCICNVAAWTKIRAFHIEQSLLRGFVVRCITGAIHATMLSESRVQQGVCLQPHWAKSMNCHTSLPLYPKSTDQFISPSFLSVKVDIQGVCMT